MAGGDTPTFVQRQRASRPWLDHLIRAGERYTKQNGDFYAGGITYYSVLSIFPVLMIAFAIAGFVLAGNDALMNDVRDRIAASAQGGMGEQLNQLVDTAVSQRAAVGVIGLLAALVTGLGWMGNLRTGLTAQWEQEPAKKNIVVTKLVDLVALLGLFLALGISFGITAVAGSPLLGHLLEVLSLQDVPGTGLVLYLLALALSVGATWVVFVWIIGFLPRERADLRSTLRAALFAAVVFEIFKQVATVYLRSVLSSPAGATFGPIIGLMVFLFFTWRILLFFTAWAATSTASMRLATAPLPDPVEITVRADVHEAPRASTAGALVGLGALLGVGAGAWFGRRRSS